MSIRLRKHLQVVVGKRFNRVPYSVIVMVNRGFCLPLTLEYYGLVCSIAKSLVPVPHIYIYWASSKGPAVCLSFVDSSGQEEVRRHSQRLTFVPAGFLPSLEDATATVRVGYPKADIEGGRVGCKGRDRARGRTVRRFSTIPESIDKLEMRVAAKRASGQQGSR